MTKELLQQALPRWINRGKKVGEMNRIKVPDELAPTCPHCFRTLEDKQELDSGLCTSDDCPRHDVPEKLK